MLQIRRPKEIGGTIVLPPNPDLFLLASCISLAAGTTARISPVEETALTAAYRDTLSGLLTFTRTENGYDVAPIGSPVDKGITFDYHLIPYRDFIVFLFLGLSLNMRFKNLPAGRVAAWQRQAGLFGCAISVHTSGDITALSLQPGSSFVYPGDDFTDANNLHACIGLALGMRKSVSIPIDHQFQSPLRHILPVFGFEPVIKSNYERKEKSLLERRLRFLAPKLLKKQESKMSFTVNFDFTVIPAGSPHVTLPGDDLLGAILIAAKSLVQRGQLFIGNMPVEPWACAILHFLRRMGCTAGIQQEAQTSFGAAGVVSLQKFKLSGHKIDCKPLYLYQRQLPMMVVCAVFAQGQSVFRELEDLRNDIPDPIERLLACVRLLGGRHGEMPDGIVVDGAKQYDGFDANEPYPASVNGTLAIAGLKCTGISAIEESDILRRWPSFATLLDTVCHYGT